MANVGVIVGRFQVAALTDAHLELLHRVGFLSDRVLVFIGVTAVGQPTKHDPLDYETRRLMILEKFPHYSIAPIVDMKLYDAWDAKLDSLINANVQFDSVTLYGGRDSFLKTYGGKHKSEVLTLQAYDSISGSLQRLEIAKNPKASEAFRAGVIYATLNSYTKVLQCVDIALADRKYSDPKMNLLLGKRTTEAKWRFVGGHAEVEGSLEENAEREAEEEAHVNPYNLKYVGSTVISDWRYVGTPESIKTAMFIGYVPEDQQKSATEHDDYDDIGEVKWFPFAKLTADDFEVEHAKLFKLLSEYIEDLE